MTLHVPFRVMKRGGRKVMQLPESGTHPARTDSTLFKALARAFRWKRMLEPDENATIADFADRDGIGRPNKTRVLRLTLLAPYIIEEILEGKQGPEGTLARVLEVFPAELVERQRVFGGGKEETGHSSHRELACKAPFCNFWRKVQMFPPDKRFNSWYPAPIKFRVSSPPWFS